MADVQLKEKVFGVLRDAYSNDSKDLVDVSDGPDDSIHIVIVSRKFDGRRMKEKNDLIWSVLVQKLTPEEWGKVSLCHSRSGQVRKRSRQRRVSRRNKRHSCCRCRLRHHSAGRRVGRNSGFEIEARINGMPESGILDSWIESCGSGE